MQSNKNVESTLQSPTAHVTRAAFNDSQPMGVDEVDHHLTADSEEIENILMEWDGTKRQLNAERQRCTELEDQLSSLGECVCV